MWSPVFYLLIRSLNENLTQTKNGIRDYKNYIGIHCDIRATDAVAFLYISSGQDFVNLVGSNSSLNTVATLPSNVKISDSAILWQPIVIISENWTPVNDVAAITNIDEDNNIKIRCSESHTKVRVMGVIPIVHRYITINS